MKTSVLLCMLFASSLANADLLVDVGESLHTPQQAMEDINSGDLTYMGRALIGGDQNYTCVYKSDRAYILYNNCMSSRKEASATDIEVISFKGGITRFYILATKGLLAPLHVLSMMFHGKSPPLFQNLQGI